LIYYKAVEERKQSMKNGIYEFKLSDQKVQLPEEVVGAIVLIVRVTLIIGFVVGAICMAVVDRVMN
jgi:hypothetical protein